MNLGCYGMPSVFSHTAEGCRKCSSRPDCEKSAYSVLTAVQAKVKVDDLLQRYRLSFAGVEAVGALTKEQQARVAKAPVKVAGRLQMLFSKGFDITASRQLREGVNPFPESGAKHLHLAGELLLKGELTRSSLRAACQQRLGWSEGTAFSQVSQAIALLNLLGLIHDTDATIEVAA